MTSILEGFKIQQQQQEVVVVSGPEKTLNEILEERDVELKELEQLNTVQDTTYMEALVIDNDEKVQGEKKQQKAE